MEMVFCVQFTVVQTSLKNAASALGVALLAVVLTVLLPVKLLCPNMLFNFHPLRSGIVFQGGLFYTPLAWMEHYKY